MLDTVSPAFAATLTQAIARLVRDDLAGNRAIWLAGNWDKSVDTVRKCQNENMSHGVECSTSSSGKQS